MALYIKPPTGNIALNKLSFYVKKRLLFLQFVRGKSTTEISNEIQQETFVNGSECLIEGSVKDKISHFVLRSIPIIVSILRVQYHALVSCKPNYGGIFFQCSNTDIIGLLCSSNNDLKAFFIQSEIELFMYRLEFYDTTDANLLLQNASKQCKEVLQHCGLTQSFKDVLCSLASLAQDFDIAIKNNCDHIKVPFTFALNFVQERLYPLQAGLVQIPLSEIKKLLIFFFGEIITQGMHQMKSSICFNELKDPRIFSMMKEIKGWFKSQICLTSFSDCHKKVILEENLNTESLLFPLCMRNLHNLLRKAHRLQHYARIQYTLFLKEIGVPYQEVISLFMKEYSVPINKKINSKCDHSWDDSKNRYIYSIEHLYGKRGSGKNYRAHSCYSLQSNDSYSVNDGGCPFSCFDNSNIEKMLTSENIKITDIEDIKLLSEGKEYTEACCSYLANKLKSLKSVPINKNYKGHCFKNIKSHVVAESILKPEQINENMGLGMENNILKCSNSHNLKSVLSRPSDFYFILSDFHSKSNYS